MLSSLSGDIYPSAFIVYYPIVDSSSADTGLLAEKEETRDFKEFKLCMRSTYSAYDLNLNEHSQEKISTLNVSCMFHTENRYYMKRLYCQIIFISTYHFIMDTPNDFSFTVQAACRALIPKRQSWEGNVSFSAHRMQTLLLHLVCWC